MTIMKKVIIILLAFIMVFAIISNFYSSFAINGSVANNFSGANANMNGSDNKTRKLIGTVLDVVRAAAVAIGLIILTVMGAKYMLASPNERAEIKQHLVIYVVGAFVMFGASAIVTIVQKFSESNIAA